LKRLLAAIGLLALLLIPANSYGQAQNLQYDLDHTLEFSINGFVKSVDRIRITNNGAVPQSIPPMTIGYPIGYGNNSLEAVVSAPFEVKLTKNQADRETFLTLTPSRSQTIEPGAVVVVSLSMIYRKIMELTTGSTYSAFLTIIPSFKPALSSVNSTLKLPSGSSLPGEIIQMTQRSTPENLIVTGIFTGADANIPRSFVNIVNMPEDVKIVPMQYPQARRIIKIDSDLSVTVSDTVVVRNLGDTAVEKLKFNFLEPSQSSVIFGPTLDPPLARPRQAFPIQGAVNLQTDLGSSVKPKEVRTLTFSYQSAILRSNASSAFIDVPFTPPIEGFVSEYAIEVEAAEGVQLSGELDIRITNASSIDTGRTSLFVRPKVFWASWTSFPIASSLFVITLMLGIAISRTTGLGTEPKPGKPSAGALVPLVEEKILEVNQILEKIRSPDATRVTPSDVSQARRSFESLGSVYNSRVGEVHRQLSSSRPELAARLKEMADLDKEYDKAVSDYLATIDRYVLKKLGLEAFRQQASAHAKRLRRLGDLLLTTANDIERIITS